MNPLSFGATFVASWLLIGLGVFLLFAVSAEIRWATDRSSDVRGAPTASGGMMRHVVAVFIILFGMSVAALGAYTLLSLLSVL